MSLPIAPGAGRELPFTIASFPEAAATARPPGAAQEGAFSERLGELMREVGTSQKNAQVAADEYASGRKNDLHGTMIAMTQADITLHLLANVRNRVIEAYREIMRMGA
jgi:flagellar hook-basal body complex protein FliE